MSPHAPLRRCFGFVRGSWYAFTLLPAVSLAFFLVASTGAEEVRVSNGAEFRAALDRARPGRRILLNGGEYPDEVFFDGIRGESNNPVVIEAADPSKPPVFRGLHISKSEFLELRDLVIKNFRVNGFNIDDGGSFETPSRGLVLRGLKVFGNSPDGNRDGIKLSGLIDFVVAECVIENWGTGGGSGIDMVGCHRGLIESNLFRHAEGTSGSTGVQAKGGTSEIIIRRNRFEHAGGRAINIGGSTGLQFFRPPLKSGTNYFEARDITVEGNTFIGSDCPVAFVGIDGALVRFNTIYHPKRWAFRILQETTAPGFVPSRNGRFTDNIVAFACTNWVQGGVNVGPGTAPETFRFARNWWYCLDRPEQSRPRLPTEEPGGVYGEPLQFVDAPEGDLTLTASSPARKAGADALP